MSGIYWERGEARIKKYGAVTTGKKTVVKVEIEVSDHHSLGYLLGSIEREEAAQSASPTATKPKTKAERIAQQQGLLMLPHHKSGGQ